MFGSYQWGDLVLEDLINCCKSDLVAGSIIYYDGHTRKLTSLGDIGKYTAGDGIIISPDGVISVDPDSIDMSNYYTKTQIDEMLDGIDAETIRELVTKVNTLETKVTTLETKVQELMDNNPEKVKFITVTMDGDKETTATDDFITADTDALPTWTSGSPNGIIEIYVETGKIIIRSSENENGTVRLRLSKPAA